MTADALPPSAKIDPAVLLALEHAGAFMKRIDREVLCTCIEGDCVACEVLDIRPEFEEALGRLRGESPTVVGKPVSSFVVTRPGFTGGAVFESAWRDPHRSASLVLSENEDGVAVTVGTPADGDALWTGPWFGVPTIDDPTSLILSALARCGRGDAAAAVTFLQAAVSKLRGAM